MRKRSVPIPAKGRYILIYYNIRLYMPNTRLFGKIFTAFFVSMVPVFLVLSNLL